MTSTQWNSSSNYIKRQLIRVTSKCHGVVACPVCCIPLTPHTVDPLLLITISNRNDIEQCGRQQTTVSFVKRTAVATKVPMSTC